MGEFVGGSALPYEFEDNGLPMLSTDLSHALISIDQSTANR